MTQPTERRKKTFQSTVLPWVPVVFTMATLLWATATAKATLDALQQLPGEFKEMRVELSRVATDVAVGKAERQADRADIDRLVRALEALTKEMRR